MITYILSRTVSKLSQIIVQIVDENVHFVFLSPFWVAYGQRTLFILGPLENP